ncbi:hypothetical protein DSM21852_25100 [Methylocystis bryophila]|nr:hypothetical protein DSM21852_25100 [Methylocystis bryophila]
MMLARQLAGGGDLGKHAADDAQIGVLHQEVVTKEEIRGHDASSGLSARRLAGARGKWRLLLPGASEPRLKALTFRT